MWLSTQPRSVRTPARATPFLVRCGITFLVCSCKPAPEPPPAVPPHTAPAPNKPDEPAAAPAEPAKKSSRPKSPEALLPPATTPLPAARRAVQVWEGQERLVDADFSASKGLVVVDLTDDWAPMLFADGETTEGKPLINRYRQVFVGLANNKTDADGQPLAPHEKNYLELFGIPPSFSVLRERFLNDEGHDCSEVDTAKLLGTKSIPAWGESTEREELTKHERRKVNLAKAAIEMGLADIAALALDTAPDNARLAREAKQHQAFEAKREAFAQVEKRMICEGRMNPAKHKVGKFDTALRTAVTDFQRETMLLDRTDIGSSTLQAMARSVGENNMLALRRVLSERATHAGGIIEDGSVNPAPKDGSEARPGPTYKTMTGEERPVPDLVTPATDATLDWLGIETAEDALAFFKRHKASDFRWLKVAVPFPPKPDYYGDHMDLSVEIDRGDVWYDFPFDAKGDATYQPRKILPSLTLFTKWRGERVPLVKWRSTVGGWRTEMASDGHEYMRYKGSDVGPRVWRHIVAAPVWIPPESTPLGGMTKRKWVNGRSQYVTNYDEVGPGYLSAYGLAMAINVERQVHSDGHVTYFDNGIRAHGSSDYRSLSGRFSHGCHRLYNNLAVRLFSFVLKHRERKTVGPVNLDFRRSFYRDEKTFDLRLPVRGYYFLLDPPMQVEVLEGNIKGKLKKPIEGYVKKPGEEYPTDKPPHLGGGQDKAGGAAPAAEGNDA